MAAKKDDSYFGGRSAIGELYTRLTDPAKASPNKDLSGKKIPSKKTPHKGGKSLVGEIYTRITDPVNASPNKKFADLGRNEQIFPGPRNTTPKKVATPSPAPRGRGGSITKKKTSVVASPKEEKVGWLKKFVRGGQKPDVAAFKRKAGPIKAKPKRKMSDDTSGLKWFTGYND